MVPRLIRRLRPLPTTPGRGKRPPPFGPAPRHKPIQAGGTGNGKPVAGDEKPNQNPRMGNQPGQSENGVVFRLVCRRAWEGLAPGGDDPSPGSGPCGPTRVGPPETRRRRSAMSRGRSFQSRAPAENVRWAHPQQTRFTDTVVTNSLNRVPQNHGHSPGRLSSLSPTPPGVVPKPPLSKSLGEAIPQQQRSEKDIAFPQSEMIPVGFL